MTQRLEAAERTITELDGRLRMVGRCRLTASKPCRKRPWFQRLTLKYDKPLSTFTFKSNLRRYRMGKMDAAAEERRHNDSNAEVTALMESARGQALNSRKVIARARNRLLREKCFRMWRCVAEHDTGTRRVRDGAAQTLALTKSGYEDKLTQQHMAGAYTRPLFGSS